MRSTSGWTSLDGVRVGGSDDERGRGGDEMVEGRRDVARSRVLEPLWTGAQRSANTR